jgi:hypothetical protein
MKITRNQIKKLILREMLDMASEFRAVPPHIAQKAQEVGRGYIIDTNFMDGYYTGTGYIAENGVASLDKEDVGRVINYLTVLNPPGGNIFLCSNKQIFNEHIIKPDASTSGIPPKYLDKIHNLIDSGDRENFNMAISLIDGLGGDPNYAYSYKHYSKVGDLEKLGNKASDNLYNLPNRNMGIPKERDSAFEERGRAFDEIYGPGGTNDQASAIVSDWVDEFDEPAARHDAFVTHNERYHSVKNKPRPWDPLPGPY